MRITALPLSVLLVAAASPPDTVRIAPPYIDAPEMAAQRAMPHGTVHSFIMRSRDSRIYPGIRQLDNAVT